MAEKEEMFKTQVVGGYDKEEVSKEIEKMQDDTYAEKKELNDIIAKKDKEIAAKETKIAELRRRLDEKEFENEKLRKNIREKYQSYIDNYESIGSLIYESKIRSDKMIQDAESKKKEILDAADAEAQSKIDAVQAEIDRRIDDGESRYKSVEEELENIVGLVNQVQREFMKSYRNIHAIVRDVPGMGSDDQEDDE